MNNDTVELDESRWQAWVEKNEERDRLFHFRAQAVAVVFFVVTLGVLLLKVF